MAAQYRQIERGPEQSLTTHPLFGTGLTLWFAALFSLATMAVRGAVLERWVLSSQLDLLLPAATPPLGFTARLLVAALAGAIGAGLGAVIAHLLTAPSRRMEPADDFAPQDAMVPFETAGAAPADPFAAAIPMPGAAERFRLRARDAHPDAPARRPIRAHEELGGGTLDAPVPLAPLPPVGEAAFSPALSATAFSAPALSAAADPLGQLPPHPAYFASDGAVLPAAAPTVERAVPDFTAPPLPRINREVEAQPPAPAEVSVPAGEDVPAVLPVPAQSPVLAQMPAEPDVVTLPPVSSVAAPEPAPAPATLTAAQRIASAPVVGLSHVELIERLAIAMQRRQARRALSNATPPAPDPAEAPEGAVDGSLSAALASLRGLKS